MNTFRPNSGPSTSLTLLYKKLSGSQPSSAVYKTGGQSSKHTLNSIDFCKKTHKITSVTP